ncbi:helix-turn-helix transcriptional regulator [Rhizobium sp. CC-YZS058]|uniref:helix-turn-helix transcriptional regulator n=1 Tax=Rhizobium sp. CC-YZS058 TaxID=3042153 RepID=UPI002B057458|nr:LuxR C-terminal-related transcriptional regulator [Rhizobium sp. CC-YZS058]MEA3535770.1 LuxR C-terminal-related transcriptional regulator [Rhizobium sp. CC-YZS058]
MTTGVLLEDRIYEAAFLPDLWPAVLDALARLIGAEGALLADLTTDGKTSIASQGVATLYEDYFREGWGFDNGRTKALMTIRHAGFISDAAHLSLEWMLEEPVYRDFLWRRDFGYAAGTVIPMPSGEIIAVSVDRKRSLGPVAAHELDRLDQMRPHLARAALVASRLQFSRIEAAVQALGVAQLPAAMLRADGRVLLCNSLFGHLEPQLAIGAQDRLLFSQPGAQKIFDRLVAEARAQPGQVRSFPVSAGDRLPPAVLHLVPIRGAARDLFFQARFLLLATPVGRSGAPADDVIQGLFDLTPGEARVAGLIAKGSTVKGAAATLDLSVETIRTYVKSFLGKAGMHRQSEFVAAMRSVRRIDDDA